MLRIKYSFFALLLFLSMQILIPSISRLDGDSRSPQIDTVTPDTVRVGESAEITIRGKNFTPDTLITLGDRVVEDFRIINQNEISFTLSTQNVAGSRTLSIRTQEGLAQSRLSSVAKPFSEISVGEITTLAGGDQLYLGDGGPALKASLVVPRRVALDGAGNLFISDAGNNSIRRVDARTGIITTIAGVTSNTETGLGRLRGDNGPSLVADLNLPLGIASDDEGNLFIADTLNNRIRRIDANTGIITSFAGDGDLESNPGVRDGVPAINTFLPRPLDVARDRSGNLYILTADRIRVVNAETGIINTTLTSLISEVREPQGIAIDKSGTFFYISDSNNDRVLRVDTRTNTLTKVAGGGRPVGDFTGDGGPATAAVLRLPTALTLDEQGNLFIADTLGNRIRRVDVNTGIITTVAGKGPFGFSNDGFTGDGGRATNATLNSPVGIAIDRSGNLFIADFSRRIRRVDARTGIINTFAGGGDDGDGRSSSFARIVSPTSLAVDGSGRLIFADGGIDRIRSIDISTGLINALVGSGVGGFSGDGGPALNANLALGIDQTIAIDNSGNIFFTDALSGRIRRVDSSTGIITTIAGTGEFGNSSGNGGPATQAILEIPAGLAIDSSGNLFVTETQASLVRRIDAGTNIINAAVGNRGLGFAGDGGPALNAVLSEPVAVAIDSANNLFIADSGNNRIRRVDAKTGVINTIAGNGVTTFNGDGIPAITAGILGPTSIAIDREGNLFIADIGNNRVRRIDARTAIITTVVGGETRGYAGDGGPASAASLRSPKAVAVDHQGNLFISDTNNRAIRVVKGIARTEAREIVINDVKREKPGLLISGNGFGRFGTNVNINGQDVTPRIALLSDESITLKGNNRKLNLRRGPNQITVSSGGSISNTFVFNFAE
jgi:trimeric autotransporter adhesin